MSVDIKASLGYGYYIKPNDYPAFDEEVYNKWHDKVCDSDYFYNLNGYDGDDEFFGIIIKEVDPGNLTAFDIDDLEIDNREWIKCDNTFHELFPYYEGLPEFYLICRIW